MISVCDDNNMDEAYINYFILNAIYNHVIMIICCFVCGQSGQCLFQH